MMLGMEEIMCEVERDDEEGGSGLPPGFRFHPTDEELITFYLASKVFNGNFCGVHIAEVDLNRCEPWELPDVAKMGEREWYFFSLRDRKYPTGLRTNRATGAGYWKATGKDRQVYSASSGALLGMKKTLVFYRGRAPRGQKTKWVMHEYRLEGDFSCRHTGKEEWVICRIFHKMGEKKSPTIMVHDHQGQNNLLIKASAYPTTTNSLPPLLEPPPTLLESQSHQDHLTLNHNQTTFLINHSTHLKSLIDPLDSRSDFFPANLSLTNSVANQDSAILLKPLLSHQDFTFKELSNAIARQCKRESNLDLDHDHDQSRHFHLLSDGFVNDRWAGERIQENCNKYEQNQNQNQLLFGTLGGGEMGLIPSPTFAGIDHVMSTEPAFRWW